MSEDYIRNLLADIERLIGASSIRWGDYLYPAFNSISILEELLHLDDINSGHMQMVEKASKECRDSLKVAHQCLDEVAKRSAQFENRILKVLSTLPSKEAEDEMEYIIASAIEILDKAHRAKNATFETRAVQDLWTTWDDVKSRGYDNVMKLGITWAEAVKFFRVVADVTNYKIDVNVRELKKLVGQVESNGKAIDESLQIAIVDAASQSTTMALLVTKLSEAYLDMSSFLVQTGESRGFAATSLSGTGNISKDSIYKKSDDYKSDFETRLANSTKALSTALKVRITPLAHVVV